MGCFELKIQLALQPGHQYKNIPRLTRGPDDLRFSSVFCTFPWASLVFLRFPEPSKALVSYRPVLVAVARLCAYFHVLSLSEHSSLRQVGKT